MVLIASLGSGNTEEREFKLHLIDFCQEANISFPDPPTQATQSTPPEYYYDNSWLRYTILPV